MDDAAVSQLIDHVDRCFRNHDPHVAAKDFESANVETVKAIYRALATADFEAATRKMTGDIEMQIVGPEKAPLVGKWNGQEEVLEAIQRNFGAVEQQRPEILGLVAQGNRVVVIGRETGVLGETGKPYSAEWTHWFTMRDGLVCHLRESAELSSLIEAQNH